MADSFLDGDLSLDTFVEDYQSKRKLAHLRRVKIDKLQEMVLKCFQTPHVSVNEPVLPHIPNSPAPFHGQVNGSSVPVRPSPTLPTQPTGQHSALPYPAAPYPSVPLPNMVPSYSSPFIQQYAPALPQRPGPGLPPRTGFIMQ